MWVPMSNLIFHNAQVGSNLFFKLMPRFYMLKDCKIMIVDFVLEKEVEILPSICCTFQGGGGWEGERTPPI